MKGFNKTGFRRWMKGLMFKHIHSMMTCKEFEEFVLGYLEGELSDQQQASFDLHLRLCRECRQYLKAYQCSINVNRAVFTSADDSLPDDVPEDLIKAILKLRDQ